MPGIRVAKQSRFQSQIPPGSWQLGSPFLSKMCRFIWIILQIYLKNASISPIKYWYKNLNAEYAIILKFREMHVMVLLTGFEARTDKKIKGRCSRAGLQTILLDGEEEVVKHTNFKPSSIEISTGQFFLTTCLLICCKSEKYHVSRKCWKWQAVL